MLVGALDVDVGGPALLRPVAAFECEDVGAPAVEPDVENVADHLVIVGAAIAEEGCGVGSVPSVYAFALESLHNARVDLAIDQQFARLAVDEYGDRHAPGALPAQHPVRALLDHRAQAVATLFGDEARGGDGVQRKLAKRRPLIVQDLVRAAALI